MAAELTLEIMDHGQLALLHEGQIKSRPEAVGIKRAKGTGLLRLADGTTLPFPVPPLEPVALSTGLVMVVETNDGEPMRHREVPLKVM
ncbi:MAG: hypothetical protein Alpg2KO_30960 [Alphaproteobacteria bacterium]